MATWAREGVKIDAAGEHLAEAVVRMEGEPGAGRDSLALLQALLGVDGSDAVDVVAGKMASSCLRV